MNSIGGSLTAQEAPNRAVTLLASGPTGGVIGSLHLSEVLGHRNVITTDMGGTSFDVGLIVDGRPLIATTSVVEKYHILNPMINIHAIGVFEDTARLYVSDPGEAHSSLKEHGYEVEKREVLKAILPNQVGALMELTMKLGNAGINIAYFYGTMTEDQEKGVIILEVDNTDLAVDIFHSDNF